MLELLKIWFEHRYIERIVNRSNGYIAITTFGTFRSVSLLSHFSSVYSLMPINSLVEAEQLKYIENVENLPSDYWQLQKMIKFINSGNFSATLIGLAALKDFELSEDKCLVGLKHSNGISTLLNLLNTKEERCILGSLSILAKVTENILGCILLSQYDGVNTLLKLLDYNNDQITVSTCSVLSNAVTYERNQFKLRQANGLKTLVNILNEKFDKQVGEYAVHTLLLCGQNKDNCEYLLGLSMMFYDKLLISGNYKIMPFVVGILAICSENKLFRTQLRTNGLLRKIINFYSSNDTELKRNVTKTIANCANDPESRLIINENQALEKLIEMIDIENLEMSKELFVALKNISKDKESALKVCLLRLPEKIFPFLNLTNDLVLVSVVSLLFELSSINEGRQAVKSLNILDRIISMMKTTNVLLLEQITLVLGACAYDNDLLKIIYERDGVRYMWSLLKSKHPKLQAAAPRSIGPCVANIAGGSDMIRSFVGGIELIVNLLKSDNVSVLVNVCRAITNISADQENLEVITDQGVIGLLSNLTKYDDLELKKQLCLTVACCSKSSRNRIQFYEQGLLKYAINCLSSPDMELKKFATKALVELSNDSILN
eukprot:NODE_102_length_20354_cov_0.272018.p2 type:complete len:604 gc:universal NODE_102_length_20354_cov_0.272018:2705-894(-)